MGVSFGVRLFICVAALVAAAAAGLAAVSRMRRGTGRKARKSSAPVQAAASKRSQDLVGLAGFEGKCAVSEDGSRTVFIEVLGRNGSFMSPQERDSEAMRLVAAVGGGSDAYTIHRVQLPVDPTGPKSRIEAAMAEIARETRLLEQAEGADFPARKRIAALKARRELLEEVYLPQCAGAASGYYVQTYVTVSKAGERAAAAAEQASAGFMRRMSEAGYLCREMEPDEIVRACVNYFGRFPAMAERAAQFGRSDKEVPNVF